MDNVVYEIRNLLTGKVYVGSSIQYETRKRRHLAKLIIGKHHSTHLQHSWDVYGEDNFEFGILEIVNNVDDLIGREQYYMDYFNSYDGNYGYNICKVAGSSIGIKHTEETKKKMSISHTGVKKGRPSDETIIKITEALRNRDSSESVKKRKNTLLDINSNIFKIIGNKSSNTQKRNGKNLGTNNPNSDARTVLIYDDLGEVQFTTNNSEFDELCKRYKLPKRALIKSKRSGGKYKLYLTKPPHTEEYSKYGGWYCNYKK